MIVQIDHWKMGLGGQTEALRKLQSTNSADSKMHQDGMIFTNDCDKLPEQDSSHNLKMNLLLEHEFDKMETKGHNKKSCQMKSLQETEKL